MNFTKKSEVFKIGFDSLLFCNCRPMQICDISRKVHCRVHEHKSRGQNKKIMEGKIKDLICGCSQILSNDLYGVKVSMKESSTCSGHFVKFRVNDKKSKKLVLWTVIKVEDQEGLVKVESYIKYLEEDFCNPYKER